MTQGIHSLAMARKEDQRKSPACVTINGMEDKTNSAIFRTRFRVPPEAIDENGHVNNVTYVQWMQDVAVEHYESMGGVEPTRELGATWVVRSHNVPTSARLLQVTWSRHVPG